MKTMILAVAMLWTADHVVAQDATASPVCETRGVNGMVTLLLCPEGLSLEEFADEGRMACGDRLPCGAWIWTDENQVPLVAPSRHDELRANEVRSAKAIWMAEQNSLITLEQN